MIRLELTCSEEDALLIGKMPSVDILDEEDVPSEDEDENEGDNDE